MLNTIKGPLMKSQFWLPLALTTALLTGCGGSDDNNNDQQDAQSTSFLSMSLPDSMTGGTASSGGTVQGVSIAAASVTAQNDSGVPCAYVGVDDDDPFRNGYQMTKLMVSAVATWSCIADFLIEIAEAEIVPHNGTIHETKNDTTAENYDPEDPTHFSISADDSDTQTTIQLYYGYPRATPPELGAVPQFYISWVENANAEVEGKLVIDGIGINAEGRNPEDPTWGRMDFHFTAEQKTADMFLRFDENNPWAEGFRIRVVKDLTADSLEQVFTAQGKIDVKAQFIPVDGVDVLPTLDMYTVSDKFGNGAAVANFADVTLPLQINKANDLGDYLFTKEDVYVFDLDGDPVWVEKSFTAATFEGGRTTPAIDGTSSSPSLDMISGYFWPQQDNYFDTNCNLVNTDCVDLLNAIFADSDGYVPGQEPNQGDDPGDWRITAIANPQENYLPSVYPNGSDWTDAFDFSFTPTLVQ